MRTFIEPPVSVQNTFTCRSGMCVRFFCRSLPLNNLNNLGYGSEFAAKALTSEPAKVNPNEYISPNGLPIS